MLIWNGDYVYMLGDNNTLVLVEQCEYITSFLIANSVSQNSSSIFTCLSVCMYVCVCSSVTFLFLQTLSSRNLSHGNISQFKFRIRTDYFGLVLHYFLFFQLYLYFVQLDPILIWNKFMQGNFCNNSLMLKACFVHYWYWFLNKKSIPP